MIFFRINSKSLSRSPTNVSQSKIKLQKSERTMDGTLVTDIIAVKDAVTFSWSYLTDTDLRRLILETQNYAFCTVEYQDGSSADIGTPKSIVAIAETFSYAPHYDYRTSGIIWKDVKLSFVER